MATRLERALGRTLGRALVVAAGIAAFGGWIGAAGPERVGDPFPLRDCPVAQHAIGGMHEPVARVYEGREVRFCCEDCVETFEDDLEASLKELDDALIKDQLPFYPTGECLFANEPLTEAGKPVDVVHNNRLVRFCCRGCVKKFKNDPAAVLAKLDEAVKEKQRSQYPLTTCIVAEEELGSMGDAVEIVVANRLVRFCCAGCVDSFMENPGLYIEKLDAAWREKHPEMFAAKKPDGE